MKSKICVIDNYDSFVYNLVHLLEALDVDEIVVYKNDEIDFDAIQSFDKILLSPGPGVPRESGQLMDVIHRFHPTHSILGVCLGHQALGEYFGWQLTQLKKPLHGVPTMINVVADCQIFHHIPEKINVGHYHSWVISPPENNVNTPLQITAVDELNNIMAIQHNELAIYGIQFHPESILTEWGQAMLSNWINL